MPALDGSLRGSQLPAGRTRRARTRPTRRRSQRVQLEAGPCEGHDRQADLSRTLPRSGLTTSDRDAGSRGGRMKPVPSRAACRSGRSHGRRGARLVCGGVGRRDRVPVGFIGPVRGFATPGRGQRAGPGSHAGLTHGFRTRASPLRRRAQRRARPGRRSRLRDARRGPLAGSRRQLRGLPHAGHTRMRTERSMLRKSGTESRRGRTRGARIAGL